MSLTRRRFLGGAAGLGVLAACGKRVSGIPDGVAGAMAPRILEAGERRTLDAFFGRLIPSDDGPGAREAGVTAYLETQLTTRELAPLLPAVRGTVKLLDRQAGNRSLAELRPAEQDAVIEALAAGKIPAPRFPQKEIFKVLHSLALEGYLGDPKHGGNAGMLGWKAIGFAEPHLRTPGGGGAHGHGR